MLEVTEIVVEAATSTIVTTQILITLVMAFSLKSMWNLMNVIQVLAYMRFFTNWPASMMEIFRYMDDAITLKPVTDPIFDYGKSAFEKANSKLTKIC